MCRASAPKKGAGSAFTPLMGKGVQQQGRVVIPPPLLLCVCSLLSVCCVSQSTVSPGSAPRSTWQSVRGGSAGREVRQARWASAGQKPKEVKKVLPPQRARCSHFTSSPSSLLDTKAGISSDVSSDASSDASASATGCVAFSLAGRG